MLIRIGGVAADGLFQHISAVVASGIFAAEMHERLIQRRGLRCAPGHIDLIRACSGILKTLRFGLIRPHDRQRIEDVNRFFREGRATRNRDGRDAVADAGKCLRKLLLVSYGI